MQSLIAAIACENKFYRNLGIVSVKVTSHFTFSCAK
jgi:hypothetical protein